MPVAYFFRPQVDLATIYSSYWLGLARSDLAALGYTVIDSYGAYATKTSFFDNIARYNPDIVVADGHGDPYSFVGQAYQEILRSCVNNEVLSGRMFTTISCLTGQTLGPDSVEKKARAYIGFVNSFTWIVTEPYNPENDPAAYPFQEIVRLIVTLSAKYDKGQVTLRQVYDRVVAEFDKWIAYYGRITNDPLAEDIIISLRNDRNGLVTLSTEEAMGPAPTPLFPLLIMGTGLGLTMMSDLPLLLLLPP